MFINSEIGRDFALKAYKFKKFIDNGLLIELIRHELRSILKGEYGGFYINSSSINLYDDNNSIFELRLIQNVGKTEILSTHPNELFIIPIVGEVKITQYTISDDGAIKDIATWKMKESPHFIGKTSITNKFYDFTPKNEKALLLFGESKMESDDIYINYNIITQKIIDIISTNITESRLEFWMSFYEDLTSEMDKSQLTKLLLECSTRKLKGYLSQEILR
jgi:hypothetical protein